jgi:hypothetical protein
VVANEQDNTLSLLIPLGGGTFAESTRIATGTSPDNIVAADFDGDGAPDLAVTNEKDNTVSVYRNVGNQTFGTPMEVPTGVGPVSITSADFSGDGHLDLAVTNFFSVGVTLLVQQLASTSSTSTASVPVLTTDGSGTVGINPAAAGRVFTNVLQTGNNGSLNFNTSATTP